MKDLKARGIMTRPVVSARKSASARDISLQLLSGLYSGMPVTDEDGKVIGVVTEFDLLGQVCEGRELVKLTAGDIMSKTPITADVDTSLNDLLKTMMENNIVRLPRRKGVLWVLSQGVTFCGHLLNQNLQATGN